MARSQRSSGLETRNARLKLPQGKRHFVTIGEGLALAYRRTAQGFGTWQARLWDGHKYHYSNIGEADDYQDANGIDLLTFYEAQEAARKRAHATKTDAGIIFKPVSVAEAADKYLAWYKDHRRAYAETEHTVKVHILPALGSTHLDKLTSATIRRWLEKIASTPARVRTKKHAKQSAYRAAPKTADEKRARKATANQIFNVLKALLNRAYQDGLVASDSAWRKVKPFPKVDEARIRFLTDSEGVRLVNASVPDLRLLINAALLTGARFGELVAMRVNDVSIRDSRVYIAQSKSGKPRHIPINPEGVTFFRAVTLGKRADDLVFVRKDRSAWGKNHHVRELANACKLAKITPPIAFHELRHTYASHLAQAGVDLLTISKLLGHADTRITSKHYAHLADRTLAAAVTKLPSFLNEPLLQSVGSSNAANV